ncbi:hypothetical protein Tco_1252634 [Tanacetum coccineum]
MIVETYSCYTLTKLTKWRQDHVSSDPSTCSTTLLEQDSLSPGPQSQENIPQVVETVTTSNELELLYSLMFSELLDGTSHVVSKSSAVHAADNLDKRRTTITFSTIKRCCDDTLQLNFIQTHQTLTQVPTVTAPENINQAETNIEYAQVDDDEFNDPFRLKQIRIDSHKTPRATLYEHDEIPGGSIYWEPYVHGIPIPVEGTYFDTLDEAIDMYTNYAKMGGFEVKNQDKG